MNSPSSPQVPRSVQVTKWIWLAGTAASVLGAGVGTAASQQPLLIGVLVVTVVQAAIAIPAAVALPRGRRWARMTLIVLAALSLGSLYQTLKMGNLPALVLNLALASTLAMLQGDAARMFVGLPARRGRRGATART